MSNTKLVKRYLNKYFKAQYINENDNEFKALVKLLNDKDKAVKNNVALPVVVKSVCTHEWGEIKHGVARCVKCGKFSS